MRGTEDKGENLTWTCGFLDLVQGLGFIWPPLSLWYSLSQMAIPQGHVPVAFETQEFQVDRAVIRRLVNPPEFQEDGESENSRDLDDAQRRLRRATSEVEALERLTWRAKVTRLHAEMDLAASLQGSVLQTGVVHVITHEFHDACDAEYQHLRDEMSRVYGEGAEYEYEEQDDEEEEERVRMSHARVGGLRLLNRCYVLLRFIYSVV
jgi:hypothetical protein